MFSERPKREKKENTTNIIDELYPPTPQPKEFKIMEHLLSQAQWYNDEGEELCRDSTLNTLIEYIQRFITTDGTINVDNDSSQIEVNKACEQLYIMGYNPEINKKESCISYEINNKLEDNVKAESMIEEVLGDKLLNTNYKEGKRFFYYK